MGFEVAKQEIEGLLRALPNEEHPNAFAQRENEWTLAAIQELLQLFTTETPEQDIAAACQAFLAKKWERIKDTNLAYFYSPHLHVTKVCVALAKAISPILKTPYQKILIPSIKYLEDFTGAIKLEDLPLHAFIVGDNPEVFISISNCLASAEEDGIMKHCVLVDGKVAPLSPAEVSRVIAHSAMAANRYHAIQRRLAFQSEGQTVGSMLYRLMTQLRSGGADKNRGKYNEVGEDFEISAGSDAIEAISPFHSWFRSLTQKEQEDIKSLKAVKTHEPMSFGEILERIEHEEHQIALYKLWHQKLPEEVWKVLTEDERILFGVEALYKMSAEKVDAIMAVLRQEKPRTRYEQVKDNASKPANDDESKIQNGILDVMYCIDMMSDRIAEILKEHPELYRTASGVENLSDFDAQCEATKVVFEEAIQSPEYKVAPGYDEDAYFTLMQYYPDVLPQTINDFYSLVALFEAQKKIQATDENLGFIINALGRKLAEVILNHKNRPSHELHPLVLVLREIESQDVRWQFLEALGDKVLSMINIENELSAMMWMLNPQGRINLLNACSSKLVPLLTTANKLEHLISSLEQRNNNQITSSKQLRSVVQEIGSGLSSKLNDQARMHLLIAATSAYFNLCNSYWYNVFSRPIDKKRKATIQLLQVLYGKAVPATLDVHADILGRGTLKLICDLAGYHPVMPAQPAPSFITRLFDSSSG